MNQVYKGSSRNTCNNVNDYSRVKKPKMSDHTSAEVDLSPSAPRLNVKHAKLADLRAPVLTQFSPGTLLNLLRVVVVVLLDAVMMSLAWLIAERVGTPIEGFYLVWRPDGQLGFLLPILTVSIGILAASGLYGTDDKRRRFQNLIKSLTLAQIVLLITAYLFQPKIWVSRSVFLLAWVLSLILVCGERLLLHFAVVNLRSKYVALQQPIFLLGSPEDIEKAKQLLSRSNQFNIQKRSHQFNLRGAADLSIRNNPELWAETLNYIRSQKVSEVFICSWSSVKDPIILFWELKSAGLRLRVLPVSLELPRQWTEIKMIGWVTTLRFSSPPIIGSDFFFKRCFDLIASSLILLVLSLPFLIIAISIKLDSPGPVFYKQTRVGLKGRHFKVWKFRTMVVNASQLQKELEAKNEVKGGVLFKMKNDPRITKVGKFLRRYSLDELPQLINVVRGEMSLVGPRPLPLRDVERFSEHHLMRHEILPGITGLWQVCGRSNVTSEEVFDLDLTYIQHWSLALDFKILIQTVKAVLAKEGAY
jgi:exopolysaccharide biosynthesis polyprenyl glycosylphosphotransferase